MQTPAYLVKKKELPGKVFFITPGFEIEQSGNGVPAYPGFPLGNGSLVHEFEVEGVKGNRIVVSGHHLYRLHRVNEILQDAFKNNGKSEIRKLLEKINGTEMMNLNEMLKGLEVKKIGGKYFGINDEGNNKSRL